MRRIPAPKARTPAPKARTPAPKARTPAPKARTAETSCYPARGALLHGVGGQVRPRAVCLHQPSGDVGILDFGLFEPGGCQVLWQWPGDRDHSIIAGPLPPDEVGHRPLTARRPAGMSLLGPALHESDQRCTQTQAEALMPLSGSEVLAPV